MTSPETTENWQKLAKSWLGIAARDPSLQGWLDLNLAVPIPRNGPSTASLIEAIESDGRASRFLRQTLREDLGWNGNWVEWSPNDLMWKLILNTTESIRTHFVFTGAICCRELIGRTIVRNRVEAIAAAIGREAKFALDARLSLRRLRPPEITKRSVWSDAPSEDLLRSGILCARIALSTRSMALTQRFRERLPSAVWDEPLAEPTPDSASDAEECIRAARHLEA